MNASGLIFSNQHDSYLPELTRNRAMAAVPFACRYRLIYFPLSSMVNAGINDISIITHANYHSLMEHIGSGKDWDLARRTGGIRILPPFLSTRSPSGGSCTSRLDALKNAYESLQAFRSDYVVLADCDAVYNLDLRQILQQHAESDSDITLLTKRMRLLPESVSWKSIVRTDEHHRLRDIYAGPQDTVGYYDVCLGVWIFSKVLLCSLVGDAIAHEYTSFIRDLILRNTERLRISVRKYAGFAAQLHSFSDYYALSMQLLDDPGERGSLFHLTERPIYTREHNSFPTRYFENAAASNSLMADGCSIFGKVENSILFRGVYVGRGAVVRNCILFQNTHVGEQTEMNYVVTDKNVTVRENRLLSGYESHPFYIEKGAMI